MNELSFKDVYSQGSLGFTQGTTPEPDLRPGSALRIDGVNVPFEVASFSFQPNEDVSSVDTGFGVVTVAWPELESSGVLSFTLEDVPKAEVGALTSLLTETRRYRWLSFRGRRYRVSGFSPEYAPDTHTRTYTFSVTCTAYRPHKSLPPVPGTEVYVVADVRRYGGVRFDDTILHVGGTDTAVVAFTTGGLCLWNPDTGARTLLQADIEAAGSVTFYEGYVYVAYGAQGKTFVRRVRPGAKFSKQFVSLDVPYSERTHTLQGDTLYFTEAGVLKKVPFAQGRVITVSAAPLGLRVNPLHQPLFLYAGTTDFAATASNVSADIIGVGRSGDNRALCFKATGLYLYNAAVVRDKLSLQGPVTDALGAAVQVAPAVAAQRFGLFGNSGMPEGFWLVDSALETLEAYLPDTPFAAPALVYGLEQNLLEGVQQAGLAEDDVGVYATGAGASFDTSSFDLSAAAFISGSQLHFDGDAGVLAYASLSGGAFVPVANEAELPGLGVDTSTVGVSLRLRFFVPAGARLRSWGFALSNEVAYPGLVPSAGQLYAPVSTRRAFLRSVYSDDTVAWDNLRGIFYSGYGYYPYTHKHLYQVFPLI